MDLLAQRKICPNCGSSLDLDLLSGFCPGCLLNTVFETERDLAPGSRIEDYELLSEVARGGMGIVYRARQRAPSRVVAVKMILPVQLNSLGAIDRFRAEAEAAASLEHDGILPIYAVGEHDGAPFYSMKFAEGGTLSARIDNYRDKPREAAALAAKLARAVAFAHEHGILHRDLKPGNVLFDSADKPYVSDFGLAKWLQRECDLTQTLAILGTPYYMAPEQATDSRHVTAAADVYSLGAILYHLLAGRPPIWGETPMEVLHRAAAEKPKSPRLTNGRVSRDLETICLKCLEKEPAARYVSAAVLADDLERFCAGHTIQARPVGLVSRAWRWSGRNPGLAALSAALLALLIVIAALVPLRRETMKPAPAEKSIAVLPFVDMSQAKDQEFFSDGISEELLNLLSKVPQLQVAARTSSFSFKGKQIEISEIARQLHVANVLEGSVRKNGDQLRITAQLVRAPEGYHLWSETYDRKLDDIFKIQDEIANEVVKQLKVTLLGAVPTVRQTDPKAYALYLQAVQLGRQSTPEAFTQSDALLRQVLETDARYAPAWHELANNFRNEANNGLLPYSEGYARAREAEEKALALDQNYAPAHAGLGFIAMANNDFVNAAKHFEQALALDATDLDVLKDSAAFLSALGRLQEGLALLEAIVRRDPVNVSSLANLGLAQRRAGQFDAAIGSYRSVLSLSPGHGTTHHQICVAMLLKGDAPAALAALAENEQEKSEVWRLIGLPMAYHALGRKTESDAALATLIAKPEKWAWAPYNIAYVYAFRGDADKAFEWLDKAVQSQDPGLARIAVENLFDNIHSDPRWLPFLRKLGRAPEQLAKIQFKVTLPP